MDEAAITVELYGDAACPWDYSAEGARLRLMWRHGEHLRWRRRMVALSRDRDEYPARGVRLGDLARGRATIRDMFGMPIDPGPATRHIATIVGCRAVVAVRRHAPEREDAFLRRLRVLVMGHRMLPDEDDTIARAAEESGLAAADVGRWMEEPATEAALEDDMRAARDPGAPALAMTERLARTPEGGWRYTCPSYVVRRTGTAVEAPGFQPARVYEVAVANLAPELAPRPEPESVEQVLAWAPYPLATVEVAAILERPAGVVREDLARVARREDVANDGFWSLA